MIDRSYRESNGPLWRVIQATVLSLALALLLSACGSGQETAAPDSDETDATSESEDPDEPDAAPNAESPEGEDVGVIHDYEVPEIPEASQDYKVFAFLAHMSDPYAQVNAQVVEEFGAEHGLDVTVHDAGGYPNIQEQISQIQSAITQGADALIVWSTDPSGIAPALQEAADLGIPVIGWVQPPDFEPAVTNIGTDFAADGHAMARALFQEIGGSGEVMAAYGSCASQYQRDLRAGLDEALAEFPDIELVVDQCTEGFDPTQTEEVVRNALTSHPDLRGVLTSLVTQAEGAQRAIVAEGRAGETIAIAQVLGDCDQVDLLKDGTLPVILGVPAVYHAQLAVAATVRALEGLEVEQQQIVPANVYTTGNIDDAPLHWELSDEFRDGC